MSMHFDNRRLRAVLAGTGMILVLSMTSSLVAASRGGAWFTGGGFGNTPEGAVQSAIWDAEASASAEGLFTCELVGEPAVFSQGNRGGRPFTAEATLSCTP